jgi:hypothetical protein
MMTILAYDVWEKEINQSYEVKTYNGQLFFNSYPCRSSFALPTKASSQGSFPRKASSEGRTFVINFVDNLGKPGLCFA